MSVLVPDGLGGWVTSSGESPSGPSSPTPITINPFNSASTKQAKAITSPASDAVATDLTAYTTTDSATSAFVKVI